MKLKDIFSSSGDVPLQTFLDRLAAWKPEKKTNGHGEKPPQWNKAARQNAVDLLKVNIDAALTGDDSVFRTIELILEVLHISTTIHFEVDHSKIGKVKNPEISQLAELGLNDHLVTIVLGFSEFSSNIVHRACALINIQVELTDTYEKHINDDGFLDIPSRKMGSIYNVGVALLDFGCSNKYPLDHQVEALDLLASFTHLAEGGHILEGRFQEDSSLVAGSKALNSDDNCIVNSERWIKAIATRLGNCGDITVQMDLVEQLMSITNSRELNPKLWGWSQSVYKVFRKISSDNFDDRCTEFLVNMNRELGQKSGVSIVHIKSVTVQGRQLKLSNLAFLFANKGSNSLSLMSKSDKEETVADAFQNERILNPKIDKDGKKLSFNYADMDSNVDHIVIVSVDRLDSILSAMFPSVFQQTTSEPRSRISVTTTPIIVNKHAPDASPRFTPLKIVTTPSSARPSRTTKKTEQDPDMPECKPTISSNANESIEDQDLAALVEAIEKQENSSEYSGLAKSRGSEASSPDVFDGEQPKTSQLESKLSKSKRSNNHKEVEDDSGCSAGSEKDTRTSINSTDNLEKNLKSRGLQSRSGVSTKTKRDAPTSPKTKQVDQHSNTKGSKTRLNRRNSRRSKANANADVKDEQTKQDLSSDWDESDFKPDQHSRKKRTAREQILSDSDMSDFEPISHLRKKIKKVIPDPRTEAISQASKLAAKVGSQLATTSHSEAKKLVRKSRANEELPSKGSRAHKKEILDKYQNEDSNQCRSSPEWIPRKRGKKVMAKAKRSRDRSPAPVSKTKSDASSDESLDIAYGASNRTMPKKKSIKGVYPKSNNNHSERKNSLYKKKSVSSSAEPSTRAQETVSMNTEKALLKRHRLSGMTSSEAEWDEVNTDPCNQRKRSFASQMSDEKSVAKSRHRSSFSTLSQCSGPTSPRKPRSSTSFKTANKRKSARISSEEEITDENFSTSIAPIPERNADNVVGTAESNDLEDLVQHIKSSSRKKGVDLSIAQVLEDSGAQIISTVMMLSEKQNAHLIELLSSHENQQQMIREDVVYTAEQMIPLKEEIDNVSNNIHGTVARIIDLEQSVKQMCDECHTYVAKLDSEQADAPGCETGLKHELQSSLRKIIAQVAHGGESRKSQKAKNDAMMQMMARAMMV